jgi:hypothetical protein
MLADASLKSCLQMHLSNHAVIPFVLADAHHLCCVREAARAGGNAQYLRRGTRIEECPVSEEGGMPSI